MRNQVEVEAMHNSEIASFLEVALTSQGFEVMQTPCFGNTSTKRYHFRSPDGDTAATAPLRAPTREGPGRRLPRPVILIQISSIFQKLVYNTHEK